MALPNQFKSARMTDSTDRATIDTHVGDLEQAICDIFGFTINQDMPAGKAVFGSLSTNNRPKQLWLEDTAANMGGGSDKNSGIRIRDETNDDEIKISVVDGFLMFYENTNTEASPNWTERTKMDLSDGTWEKSLGYHGVKAYSNSYQSIDEDTDVAFNADEEYFDTDTYHDNVTNKTRITIPTALPGYYLISVRILIDTSTIASTSFYMRVKKNGSSDIMSERMVDFSSTVDRTYFLSSVVSLAGDDYIEAIVFYSTSGTPPVPMKLREFSATLLGQ